MANILKNFLYPGTKLSAMAYMMRPAQRSLVCNESGSILEKPIRVRFGVLKVLMVVLPSIYVGGIISRTGAQILEEHDIFVPESDDDDD